MPPAWTHQSGALEAGRAGFQSQLQLRLDSSIHLSDPQYLHLKYGKRKATSQVAANEIIKGRGPVNC